MRDYERVEFRPPQGVSIPEGQEGENFDLVCSFKRKPDGTICMTQFGDAPMPGYDKEKMHEAKPDYGGYVGSMKEAGYPNT